MALSFEVRKEQKTEGEEKFSMFENQFYDIVPLHSCARELKPNRNHTVSRAKKPKLEASHRSIHPI